MTKGIEGVVPVVPTSISKGRIEEQKLRETRPLRDLAEDEKKILQKLIEGVI